MTTLIRVFDCETTGLNPATHRICEVATVDLEVNEPTEESKARGYNQTVVQRGEMWSSLVDPGVPIPPEAAGVHGIVDDMVKGKPAIGDLAEYIKRGPPDFYCAHVAKFDSSFFRPAAIPWLCTYKIALWLWPDCPVHKNAVLRYWLKLKFAEDPGVPHRALPDAIITAAVLRRAIMEGAAVEEMARVSEAPAFLPRLTFGEHAMKPIADVPDSYLSWILQPKQAGMNEDVRHTAYHELQRRRIAKSG